jgi:hypothetical protein
MRGKRGKEASLSLRDTIVFNDAFQTPKSVFPQAGYFIEKVTRLP